MTRQEYIYAKEIEKLKEKLKKYERTEIHKGDIVYLKQGISEYNRGKYNYKGIRPWVIISCDKTNSTSPNCVIVPLTTKDKHLRLPTHIPCSYHRSIVCCEDIRVIEQESIKDIVCHLDEAEMNNVANGIKALLGI